MDIICEICDNKNHNNLPYKMSTDHYNNIICHICNKTVYICYDCKKYIWFKPTYGNNNVPNTYRRVIDELYKYSYPKCKNCWDKHVTSDFDHCHKCRIFTAKTNMVYCSNCNSQNCNDCNKERIYKNS